MEKGTFFTINGLVLEVCEAKEHQCSGCIAVGKIALCRKLPDCSMNKYFRKLSPFEIRQIKKNKKTIENL